MTDLRDYQRRTVDEVLALLTMGKRAPLIVAPTGSGKTTIGAELARIADAQGGSTLWLAHRRELLVQASARLASMGVRRVATRTVQELLASGERPAASHLSLDEAHHYVADSWGELAKAYPDAIRIGLTATPERADGRGLGAAFDGIVVAASVRELTERGYLVPCEVVRPAKRLEALAADPVDAYVEHAGGRRAIVFAANSVAAAIHCEALNQRGVRAALVKGDTPASVRDVVLEEYRAGRTRVLVNVYVLTEGFDAPATEVVILARGCGSAGAYLQMVGRALRPSPETGKTSALLIDLRGVSHVHGDPDEPRVYSLDGRAIRRGVAMPEGSFCSVCGATLEESGACVDCRFARPELGPPPVRPEPLAKYARLRQDDDAQRAARLLRWIADARARGYAIGWAFGKFRAVYGAPPTASVRALMKKPRTSAA